MGMNSCTVVCVWVFVEGRTQKRPGRHRCEWKETRSRSLCKQQYVEEAGGKSSHLQETKAEHRCLKVNRNKTERPELKWHQTVWLNGAFGAAYRLAYFSPHGLPLFRWQWNEWKCVKTWEICQQINPFIKQSKKLIAVTAAFLRVYTTDASAWSHC